MLWDRGAAVKRNNVLMNLREKMEGAGSLTF
jgi:hypothetical protein